MTRGLFISGAHVDHKCMIAGPAIMGASNPGTVEMFAGGAGFNAAATAASLGVDCTITGKIGIDPAGGFVSAELEKRGIRDCLVVSETLKTGSYTSVLSSDGELIIAHADLPEYDRHDIERLINAKPDIFTGMDFWFTNANLGEDALQAVFDHLSTFNDQDRPRLALATISPAKAPRINSVLERGDYLFTNVAEARALLNADDADPHALASMLCERIARGTMSDGADPLFFWEDGAVHSVTPPKVANVVDVTGAGDALAGATLGAHYKPLPFADAVRCGLGAAALTVQSPLPYAEGLSWTSIAEMMDRN